MKAHDFEFDEEDDAENKDSRSLIPLNKPNELRKSNFISLEFDFFVKKFKLKISKN